MNTDQKIAALQNGESVVLSQVGAVRCVAERSGDGKTLRIVREQAGGFVVIRATKF